MASKAARKNANLGLWIRARRLALGVTQKQLADLAATRPSIISRLESGERVPRPATLGRIQRILEME